MRWQRHPEIGSTGVKIEPRGRRSVLLHRVVDLRQPRQASLREFEFLEEFAYSPATSRNRRYGAARR